MDSLFTTYPCPAPVDSSDVVSIRALTLPADIGPDIWLRKRPQPVTVSLSLYTDISAAGATDDLSASIHYGNLTKAVSEHITTSNSGNLIEFVDGLAECCFLKGGAEKMVKIVAELPEALTMAEGVGIEAHRQRHGTDTAVIEVPGFGDALYVRGLRVPCIIGVNPPERESKQVVVVNLRCWDIKPFQATLHRPMVQKITDHIEKSSYLTIEALVTSVCRIVCVEYEISKVTVRAEKPSALTFAQGAAVEITRRRDQF